MDSGFCATEWHFLGVTSEGIDVFQSISPVMDPDYTFKFEVWPCVEGYINTPLGKAEYFARQCDREYLVASLPQYDLGLFYLPDLWNRMKPIPFYEAAPMRHCVIVQKSLVFCGTDENEECDLKFGPGSGLPDSGAALQHCRNLHYFYGGFVPESFE